MEPNKIVEPTRHVSSLHHFTPYRGAKINAETIATGCVLVGMLCFAGLLFVHCLDVGVIG